MEDNTQNPLPEINPVVKALSQILMLLGLFFICSLLFVNLAQLLVQNLFGFSISGVTEDILKDLADSYKVNGYKVFQLIVSLGSFAATAWLFVRFFAKENPAAYFGYKNIFPQIKILGLVMLIAFAAFPLLSYISYLTTFIPIPAQWQSAMQEQANNAQISAFLKAENGWILLLNIVVMAIVPAVGEELLFRGTFMQLFYRFFNGRIHGAIWLTAFLFSVMHLHLTNFFAILLMGALFGYLYYWSGNIMVVIWAHFINNATAVVFDYLHQHFPNIAFLGYEYQFQLPEAIASAIIVSLAVVLFYRQTKPYHSVNE